MNKIKIIENLVKKECGNSKYFAYKDFQWNHMNSVRKYSVELAKKLKADVYTVEIAALLHDIGRLRYGPDNHELTSSEEAVKILQKLRFEKGFIEKIRRIILTHRGHSKHKPKSLEEKIVACADAMSHFDSVPELLILMAKNPGTSIKFTKEWVNKKIANAWIKVSRIPFAREMVRKKYEAAQLLLKEH